MAPTDEASRFADIFDESPPSPDMAEPVAEQASVITAAPTPSDPVVIDPAPVEPTPVTAAAAADQTATEAITAQPEPNTFTRDTTMVGTSAGAVIVLVALVRRLRDRWTAARAVVASRSDAARSTAKPANAPSTRRPGQSAWPLIGTGAVAGLTFMAISTGSVDVSGLPVVNGLVGSSQVSSAAPQQARTNDPVVMLTIELDRAREFAKPRNGAFTGFVPTAPVMAASAGPNLVVTVVVDGRCWSSGITAGYPTDEIRYDPTGKRCVNANLEALQIQMDQFTRR